jgi:hypothetical protein
MEVGDTLLQLGCGDIASELCEVEMHLAQLHEKCLERAGSPSTCPKLRDYRQEDVPF